MQPEYIEQILAGAKHIHLTDDEIAAHHDNVLIGFTLARAKAHLGLCHICNMRAVELEEGQKFFDEHIIAEAPASHADTEFVPPGHTSLTRGLSIAVLPPEKININTSGGVLTFALLDQVTARLSENNQFGDMQFDVRSLSAVLNARSPFSNPIAVGKELAVDRVLTIKDVRRDEQNISFTTRLIDVGADKASKTGRSGDEHIFERWLQGVNLKLTKAVQKRLLELDAAAPSASTKYTLGRFYLHKFSGSGLERAIGCFTDAIELDKNFAEAYSGLADCYVMEGIYNIAPPATSFGLGLSYAKKALDKNPGLTEVHASQAYTYMCYERDWGRAKDGFEKAIELNSTNAFAYQGWAHLHGALGEFTEAMRKIDRALAIDPVSPMIYIVRAFILYYAGCNAEADWSFLRKAREQCLQALRLNRRFDPAWYIRALICVQLALFCRRVGRLDEAEEYFKEAEEAAKKARDYTKRNAQKQATLTFIYFLWGKEDEALQALAGLNEALNKDSYISPYHMALVHIARNQSDDAIKCLEQALNVRDQWMILLRFEPAFKVLHGDERFKELIRELRFPPSLK